MEILIQNFVNGVGEGIDVGSSFLPSPACFSALTKQLCVHCSPETR